MDPNESQLLHRPDLRKGVFKQKIEVWDKCEEISWTKRVSPPDVPLKQGKVVYATGDLACEKCSQLKENL